MQKLQLLKIFIVALLSMEKNWTQPTHPLEKELINSMGEPHEGMA